MARVILEKMLKRKGLSKRQFAKRIGMDPKHVARLCSPSYNPTVRTLSRWAKAIGCGVRDMIEE